MCEKSRKNDLFKKKTTKSGFSIDEGNLTQLLLVEAGFFSMYVPSV